MTPGRWSLDKPLAAVLVLAAAVRVGVILATPHYVPLNDAADYDHAAVSLAVHGSYPASGVGGPSALRPPGFPVLLALVDKVVGTGSAQTRWESGRVMQAILGVVIVWLIFAIGRRIWGRQVGLTAAALAAVYPPLLLAGSSLMTEPLYIALTLGAVLAGLQQRGARHGVRWAALAGVLAGLAAITRGNGIFFVLPLAFLVWNERPRRARSAMRAPVVLIAATLCAIAPWAIRNTLVFHQFVPLGTETGYALSGTYNDAARDDHTNPALWRPLLQPTLRLHAEHPRWNEADISNQLVSQSIDFMSAHPGYPFVVAYWSFVRLLNLEGPGLEHAVAGIWSYPGWLAEVSVYAFWLVGLLALIAILRRATPGAPWAFWACPVALAVPNLLFLGLTRYRVPADPYVLLLAAGSVLSVLPPLRRRLGAERVRRRAHPS